MNKLSRILPHAALDDEITLEVEHLVIDDAERKDLVEGESRRLDLTDPGAPWTWVEVVGRASAPADEVEQLRIDGAEVAAVLVAWCSSAKLRRAVPAELIEEDAASWLFRIRLAREDLREKVELHCDVAASYSDRPVRRIGSSSSWAMYVDETARPPVEGTFLVKWSHFRGEHREPGVPEIAASESFFLDLAGSVPIVRLNKDVDGFVELLEGEGGGPLERALREAELRRIATAAWTSAIGVATAAIRIDPETDEHTFPESPWQTDVLRWCLPVIYPLDTEDEGLKKLKQNVTADGAAVAQALIQLAVSRHMNAGDLLKQALNAAANER